MICDCDVWTGDTAACRVELSSRVSVRFDNSCLLLRPSFQDWTPLGNVVLIAQRKHFFCSSWIECLELLLCCRVLKPSACQKPSLTLCAQTLATLSFFRWWESVAVVVVLQGIVQLWQWLFPWMLRMSFSAVLCVSVCHSVSTLIADVILPLSILCIQSANPWPAERYGSRPDAIVSVTWTILTNTITLHYSLSLFPSLFSIGFLSVWDPQCETLYGPWILVCPSVHSSIYPSTLSSIQ